MGNAEFTAFSKEQTKTLLNALDIKIQKVGVKEFIMDDKKKNEIAVCPVCEEQLTPDNLGNIIKGSKILFCDNPSCFNHHLLKKLL